MNPGGDGGGGRLRRLLGDVAFRLSPCEFEIHHRPGAGTEIRGPIAKARHGEIDAFFRRDLNPSRPLRVRGTWRPGGPLRLWFAGPIDEAGRQQTRNFLLHHLR